jgi:hypothetical protein
MDDLEGELELDTTDEKNLLHMIIYSKVPADKQHTIIEIVNKYLD